MPEAKKTDEGESSWLIAAVSIAVTQVTEFMDCETGTKHFAKFCGPQKFIQS